MADVFFPSMEENFTRVPNVFFEKILPDANGNELKAMLFIIRKTLGWNKKWNLVSRAQFISDAGISNGSLTKTLQSCIEKGWLLKYEEGPKNKTQVYYFLNDCKNKAIVRGLNNKLFSIKNLAYLNEAGILELLKKHNLLVEDKDLAYKKCRPKNERPTENVDRRGTETVERGTKSVDRRGTETVDQKSEKNTEAEAFEEPLKENNKDNNILKTDERQQQQSNVSNKSYNCGYDTENRDDVVASLIEEGKKIGIPVDKYTAKEMLKVGKGNLPVIVDAMKAAAQWAEGKIIRNWYGVLIKAVADERKPAPDYNLRKRKDKYRDLYMNWGG